MGRTLIGCRGGLSVAAAVVLLTACGGSDDDSAASSSASRTSASETSAGGADSEFCTQAGAALDEVEPALVGGADPAALATALQDAADRVRAIDPPGTIEHDWTALADGIERLGQAYADVDPGDPASQSGLQQRTGEVIGSLSAAATKVQNYLATECGIDVSGTGSASPTS
jgi:hypothetical protein